MILKMRVTEKMLVAKHIFNNTYDTNIVDKE